MSHQNHLVFHKVSLKKKKKKKKTLEINKCKTNNAASTQSFRVSDFRDIFCSLFPKAILFDFYSVPLELALFNFNSVG